MDKINGEKQIAPIKLTYTHDETDKQTCELWSSVVVLLTVESVCWLEVVLLAAAVRVFCT